LVRSAWKTAFTYAEGVEQMMNLSRQVRCTGAETLAAMAQDARVAHSANPDNVTEDDMKVLEQKLPARLPGGKFKPAPSDAGPAAKRPRMKAQTRAKIAATHARRVACNAATARAHELEGQLAEANRKLGAPQAPTLSEAPDASIETAADRGSPHNEARVTETESKTESDHAV
jgi:hypothetical protein